MIEIKNFSRLSKLDEELANIFLTNLLNNKKILVSGGKSFRSMFKQINFDKLNIKKINISLTDERIVSISSNKSNQKYLIKLLSNKLNNKIFDSFFLNINNMSHKEILSSANHKRRINTPNIAFIGVGLDGHIASIFEDSKKILNSGYFSIIKKSDEKFFRVTHTIHSLLQVPNIILVFRGKNKSRMFYSKIFSLEKNVSKYKNIKIVKSFIKSYKGNLLILTS